MVRAKGISKSRSSRRNIRRYALALMEMLESRLLMTGLPNMAVGYPQLQFDSALVTYDHTSGYLQITTHEDLAVVDANQDLGFVTHGTLTINVQVDSNGNLVGSGANKPNDLTITGDSFSITDTSGTHTIANPVMHGNVTGFAFDSEYDPNVNDALQFAFTINDGSFGGYFTSGFQQPEVGVANLILDPLALAGGFGLDFSNVATNDAEGTLAVIPNGGGGSSPISITTSQQPATATVGSPIADQATVSGNNPTGTVTFNLYNNPNATGTPLFTDANEPLVNGVATSQGYTAAATGTDYWVATYNGDSNNNSVTSGTALEPVTISAATPLILTSQQPASAMVGVSIADQATVSGGFNPTGTVTFNLYNNPNATGTPLFTDTEILSGGIATSKGYTTAAAGTDYWVAAYNGDSNNNAITSGTAVEPVTVIAPGTITGTIFDDCNDNGVQNTGETGIGGVQVSLTGTNDLGQQVSLTTTTATDGTYSFTGLRPGTYAVTQTLPSGYLNGPSSTTNTLPGIVVTSGATKSGNNFADITPDTISGNVWLDFNNDGNIDFGEAGIGGVVITLTGTNDLNQPVSLTTTTLSGSSSGGLYVFKGLRPGTYTLTETQPSGYVKGKDTLGSVSFDGGAAIATGTNPAAGVFQLTVQGCSIAFNYNFAELPPAGSTVHADQTATIGFWQNKNGQALLNSLNGGPTSTQLGNWLAATFPHLYGFLAGKTNSWIASFYVNNLFAVHGMKVDAQIMSAALAAYVTDATLAGSTATAYGFAVNSTGTAVATYNVGSNGAAFGVANNTSLTVLSLLQHLDALSSTATYSGGVFVDGLYGVYTGPLSVSTLENMANTIFDGLNTQGDI